MNFKQVASYDNFMLANMALGLLQDNGIDCHLKDENIVTIDPLLNPAVGGIKLMVPEDDFERSKSYIRSAEEQYLKEIPCPFCKSLSINIEEKTSVPEGFWGKLKNQVLFGQTGFYEKNYRCGNCKKIITELPDSF